MSQPDLNLLDGDALAQQQACAGMPLRYNYDKPEMPRISKGFWDCQACFSSFSKPKNRAAKYLFRRRCYINDNESLLQHTGNCYDCNFL